MLPFSGPHHWAGSTWSRPAAAGHSGRTAESAVPGPDPELDPADLQRRDDSTGRQRRAEFRHFPGFGELLGAADADRDHLFSLHVSVTSSPERLKERERLNHQQRQNNKNFFQKKETKLFKKAKKIFFVFFHPKRFWPKIPNWIICSYKSESRKIRADIVFTSFRSSCRDEAFICIFDCFFVWNGLKAENVWEKRFQFKTFVQKMFFCEMQSLPTKSNMPPISRTVFCKLNFFVQSRQSFPSLNKWLSSLVGGHRLARQHRTATRVKCCLIHPEEKLLSAF